MYLFELKKINSYFQEILYFDIMDICPIRVFQKLFLIFSKVLLITNWRGQKYETCDQIFKVQEVRQLAV